MPRPASNCSAVSPWRTSTPGPARPGDGCGTPVPVSVTVVVVTAGSVLGPADQRVDVELRVGAVERVRHLRQAHVLERLAGAGDELADPCDLEVGDRARAARRSLVDHAEVVGEQHRHLHRAQHPLVVARAVERAGPERPAPLGVVLPELLRRLRRRPCRTPPASMPIHSGSSVGHRRDHPVPVADRPLVAEVLRHQGEDRADRLADALADRGPRVRTRTAAGPRSTRR